VEELLNNFLRITADPYKGVKEWKEKNRKKVIGCFPMWIPEEIIHAAGMLPVVIWRGNEPVTEGHAHVPPYNCGLTRSFVDDAVRGKLSFMDGVVFYRMCLQEIGLRFTIAQHANPRPAYLEYLYLPPVFDKSPCLKDFLVEELERFKESLEKFGGEEITTDSLLNSIRIYNENHQLLRRLYQLRREKPGLVKAKEILAIVHSSMLMPKEEHSKMLKEILVELEKVEAKAETEGKIKVIPSGCFCQTPSTETLDLIEELGMVVDDDMYIGSRYFATDAEVSDNPIQALADRYMKDEPVCPTKGEWYKKWGDYLLDMVKRNHADGVISLLVKYCPPHLCWYPALREVLAGAGIPHIMVEVEHEVTSLEPVRTRLESFVEMVKGGV
jgi:benzoyl-CoA reductase subunit C